MLCLLYTGIGLKKKMELLFVPSAEKNTNGKITELLIVRIAARKWMEEIKMREILFRGKHAPKYGTGWCFGVPYIDHDGDCILANDCSKSVVVEETVGQYTSLTDKNGKMIFEGDILQAGEYRFTVKFGKCGGVKNVDHEVGYIGFYVIPIGKDSELFIESGVRTDILYWLNAYEVSVIGNIHDDPELLETN